MGFIEAICISRKKGVAKKPVETVRFISDWGINGDAHAGRWHRQVSLLAGESIDRMRQKLPQLAPGAFAENLVVRGLDISAVRVGDMLQIADIILLEVTQIGKECHTVCAIRRLVGDCIMPREGIFARVVKGGIARAGDPIHKMAAEFRTTLIQPE